MQDTVEKAQAALEKAIKLMALLEKQSCEKAANCDQTAMANAGFTLALGALYTAKGHATAACMAAPDVTPQFGGK